MQRHKIMSLPPATKLGQGYIFTGICDSVHKGGGAWSWGVLGPWGCLVLGGGVPGGDPLKTATAVGSMHPTGMHSCLISDLLLRRRLLNLNI